MVALDSSKRPFTPPFAQLIKVSHRHQAEPSTTTNEKTPSQTSNDPRSSGTKEYIYDAKLKCYYDPETNEYFQDVRLT